MTNAIKQQLNLILSLDNVSYVQDTKAHSLFISEATSYVGYNGLRKDEARNPGIQPE